MALRLPAIVFLCSLQRSCTASSHAACGKSANEQDPPIVFCFLHSCPPKLPAMKSAAGVHLSSVAAAVERTGPRLIAPWPARPTCKELAATGVCTCLCLAPSSELCLQRPVIHSEMTLHDV